MKRVLKGERYKKQKMTETEIIKARVNCLTCDTLRRLSIKEINFICYVSG